MLNLRNAIFGFGCILSGAFLADYFGDEAGAQTFTPIVTEAESWELHVGRYNTQGAGASDDARFYVVRHNRLTGETQYIGCEDRDACTQFSVEIQD